ncbi:hypothetical protein [Escherichia coli]|uniref:Y-family DNA polymerase n=1 Tax=Escherichia coli TaxID=562 RepID=UPI003C6D494B
MDSLFHTNGDISRRVMTTLEALASRVDVYSIDEAFLDLTGIDRVVSFEPFGRQAIWLNHGSLAAANRGVAEYELSE